MVYCGIPSRACLGCRTRRTKCDYLKPSCSQCIRMGRICNGYRDPVAVLFRDESKGFATKRQRLTGPRKPHSAVARKSSLEIDAALAACSTMFISSPLSDPDQSCGTSLSEPMEDLLDECSSVKDKGTSFLETSFTIEHLNTGQGHKRFDPSNFAPEISNPDYGSSIGINPQLLDKAQSANQATLVCGLDSRTGLRSLIIHSSITSSLEIQAPCFFFSNYVLENTSYSKGFLDYLPGLCANEVANSFLMQAVTALGLVGLAMKTHDSNVLISARQDYASALNQLNVALTSKERALTDQALTTVFLLGLYETNTCSTPQNLRAWTKHIKGAIAMLQLRGKRQLDSLVGRQIFVQWRNQIVAYCLHRRTAIPEFVTEWSQELLQHEDANEAMETSLCITTAKLCALRADMKYFRNYSKSAKIVPLALAIDVELSAWADNCSASHPYTTTAPAETSEFVYEGHFHVYSSITEATVWNEHRRMRMLCHELLAEHLRQLIEHRVEYSEFELSTAEMKCQLYDSKEMIERLAKEICASVPFHFGLHLGNADRRTGTLAPKAVCGNLLLRPLYMAGAPRFVSNRLRKWVIGRFEKISEMMGIKLATSLGHLVRIGVDPDEWENTLQGSK